MYDPIVAIFVLMGLFTVFYALACYKHDQREKRRQEAHDLALKRVHSDRCDDCDHEQHRPIATESPFVMCACGKENPQCHPCRRPGQACPYERIGCQHPVLCRETYKFIASHRSLDYLPFVER